MLGPMRNSDMFASIGLMSTFGAIHILVLLFFLYGQGQLDGRFYSPPSNPTVINPPGELFNSESWMDFTSGFWLGGSGGAALAWFVYTNSLVRSLYEVFFVR
jgi:photosystem I subunit 11